MKTSVDQPNDKATGPLQILTRIKKIQTPMQNVQAFLLKMLRQYRAADKVGVSLGVMESSSSFSDHLNWNHVIEELDEKKENLDAAGKSQLHEFLNYLETTVNSFEKKIVVNIQKVRDQWMRKVLLLDLLVVAIVSALITVIVFYSGLTVNEEIVVSAFSNRPLFYSLVLVIVLILAFLFHCFIRRRTMLSMLDDNNALAAGMSMAMALQKNARLRHSVFRPMPVGWNVIQKIRLSRMKTQLAKLRRQLEEVVLDYPDKSELNKGS